MTSTISAERTLDLRSVAAPDRSARALGAFDALAPGQDLVLLAADSSDEVLRLLQAERRGVFEWSPLEARSGGWRIQVRRRAAEPGQLRAVTEALAWDHDRLDALEAAAFRKRSEGDLDAARALYAEFALGLRRHIGFEEQLLFPAFERGAGLPPTAGPTAVMRAEHREIEGLLDRIEAGMGEAGSPAEALRRELHAVLGDHNLKEEQVLYPSTDDLLGTEEADRLVSQIQRLGS